jgi:hypothetical protein
VGLVLATVDWRLIFPLDSEIPFAFVALDVTEIDGYVLEILVGTTVASHHYLNLLFYQ